MVKKRKCFSTKNIQNLWSDHIYIKDVECAETNEKSIFQFFQFYFFEIWPFLYSKLVHFRWTSSEKSTITQKIKIGKFIFHSFQDIAHLLLIWDHFWGRGSVCISLVGKNPTYTNPSLNEIGAKLNFFVEEYLGPRKFLLNKNIGKLFLHTFQNIAHLLGTRTQFCYFWREGVCNNP